MYGWTRDLVFSRPDDDYRRADFCRVIICIHSDRIQPKSKEFKTSVLFFHVVTYQPLHIEDECIFTVSGQEKLMNDLKYSYMINRIVSIWNNCDTNEHRAYIENSLSTKVKDTDQDASTDLDMIRQILNSHVFVHTIRINADKKFPCGNIFKL